MTIDDVKRSIHIYVPDVVCLKVKKTRGRPEPIGVMDNISLPPEIYRHHWDTIILVDYLFVHGLCHLHSTSRGYGFKTIEYIPAKKASKKRSQKELRASYKYLTGYGSR